LKGIKRINNRRENQGDDIHKRLSDNNTNRPILVKEHIGDRRVTQRVPGRAMRHAFSLLTSHGRASGLTVRFQDLVLTLSECVDLGLFAASPPGVTAASDLAKVSRKGFEMNRVWFIARGVIPFSFIDS
jgi:hypothetical protein